MSVKTPDSVVRSRRAGHLSFKHSIPPLYLQVPKKKTAEIVKVRTEETFSDRLKRLQSQFTAAQLLCLRMEFNYFDDNHSNSIDLNELRRIVDSMGGEHIKDDELTTMMKNIDKDKSGEVDWIEYLNMMVQLSAGEADLNVTKFMERDPVVLIVHTNKMTANYIRSMCHAAAEEANIKVNVVLASNAEDGLRFMHSLSPGRRVSLILCSFEMFPYNGTWFLDNLRKESLFLPVCYFVTENDLNSKLHRPAGSEGILHTMDLEQHELMLMIVRYCSSKKKKKRLTHRETAMKHALDDQRHEDDTVHEMKKGKRIGNGGIAYKPSKPREATPLRYVSLNRWKGTNSEISSTAVEHVLKKNGAERPRVIPVNSPRFQQPPRRPSWYNNIGADGCNSNENVRNRSSKSGKNESFSRSVLQNAGKAAALASSRVVHGLDLTAQFDRLLQNGRRGRPMARGKGSKKRIITSPREPPAEQDGGKAAVADSGSVRLEVPKLNTTLVSPRPTLADLARHTPRNKF